MLKSELEHDIFGAGWKIKDGYIQKEYLFHAFVEVIDFLNILWSFFEEIHHHPDFTVRFNKISFFLRTHEKNKITKKDYILAEVIENVYFCLTER